MKPSFVPRMNRADVLILIGLYDEYSRIPALLEVAGNPKILPGQAGLYRLFGWNPGARSAGRGWTGQKEIFTRRAIRTIFQIRLGRKRAPAILPLV